MEMSDFFDFCSKLVLSNALAYPVELKKNENELWEDRDLIKGIYKGINFPVVFKQDKESGNKFTDVLDTGHPNLYLISDRMKTVLKENHLTGWQTYPIKLYDKKGNEIFGYHGFSVVGHCGPESYKNSEIIEKQFVPEGPICKYYKGVFFDAWDGTDFFTPKGVYSIFITKKAAEVLKKNKLTNIRLENLSEYEMNVDDLKR